MLDLNHVRSFVAVVTEGSFAGASRAMALPTSSLSRHISRLEAQAGARLLERTTRSLRMTEAGRLLYARARSMVTDMTDLETALQHHHTSFQGVLDIGVPAELGGQLLGPILAAFCAEHPQLECRIRIGASDPLRDDLDLAITFRRGAGKPSSMIAKTLASLRSCVVAAPALIASHGMPTEVRTLASLPCISTLDALDGAPWRFVALGGNHARGKVVQLAITARYRVDSGAMARAAAIRGVGFALLPEIMCADALTAGTLRRVSLDLAPAPLDVIAVYPSRHKIPKARALLARLRAGITAALSAH